MNPHSYRIRPSGGDGNSDVPLLLPWPPADSISEGGAWHSCDGRMSGVLLHPYPCMCIYIVSLLSPPFPWLFISPAFLPLSALPSPAFLSRPRSRPRDFSLDSSRMFVWPLIPDLDVIVFKPFVSKLRSENEHTFSIMRMIPRKELVGNKEVEDFIKEMDKEDDR